MAAASLGGGPTVSCVRAEFAGAAWRECVVVV